MVCGQMCVLKNEILVCGQMCTGNLSVSIVVNMEALGELITRLKCPHCFHVDQSGKTIKLASLSVLYYTIIIEEVSLYT